MRPSCFLIRRFLQSVSRCHQRRQLLTLAIETSCDDTSVAVLEKHRNNSATLHFHETVTSDNRSYGGIHPILAHESHQQNLSKLVRNALQSLPIQPRNIANLDNALLIKADNGTEAKRKPDFVTVTRGPGMRANLITGLDTAKGLSVAWQVPLLGVNHMQAHALTPRLVSALSSVNGNRGSVLETDPPYPFLTLLVSGGHTMLVHSKSLCDHEILANQTDLAVGDAIDKCARDILPPELIQAAPDVMYGRLLESFIFPGENPNYFPAFKRSINGGIEGYDWAILKPFSNPGPGGDTTYADSFSFSGIGSTTKRIVSLRPSMSTEERRVLGHEAMRRAFNHLASRILFALERPDIKNIQALVVSGGVASNRYLKHLLRRELDQNGQQALRLIIPPPTYCTDNAAMIAWTGIEMFEAGFSTSLEALSLRKWSVDPKADDGGISGIGGWKK